MFRNILRSIVKSFMTHGRSQSGYILVSLMALTALIPGLVLVGLNYTDIIEQGSRISKTTITKTQMHTIRNIVANSARDVDADGAFDVWREGTGNTVPATVTVNSRDQWGTDFRYCAYDLLACNQVDAAFSQNNPNAPCVGFSPPTTNLVLRIISAGRDRIFQTDCRSTSSFGDDIVLNEVEAGIRVGGTGGAGGGGTGGGGWTDDGSVVRLTDPNDRVGIGTLTPLGSLDVIGGDVLGGADPANNWVYLRGNVHGTMPSALATQGLMYGWNSSGGHGESQILYSTGLGVFPRLDFGRWSGTARIIDMTLRDGNFGIGTANPMARLDVVGSEIFNAINDPLARFGTAGPSNSNSIVVYNGAGGTSLFVSGNPHNFIPNTVAGDGGIRVSPGRNIFFGDALTARMVITSAGSVGIGTAAPQQRLDVAGYIRSSFASNEGPGLMLTNPLKTGAGTARDWIIFNMTGAYGNSLQFWAYDTLGCNPGALLCAPRLVITDAGNIGIGTWTGSPPIRMLDVRGGIIANSYEHHSSRDSKSNIQTIKAEEALSILNQLRPVEFKYKDNPEERRLGFIAEEVPKILTSEDRQGVKVMDTVAALTKVIQEQQREIEELKSNIDQLESNNVTTSQNSNKIDIDTAFKIIAMSLIIALSIKISRVR